MQTLLLIVHIAIAVLLIGSVLLQKSDGGALGIGGNSDNLIIYFNKHFSNAY